MTQEKINIQKEPDFKKLGQDIAEKKELDMSEEYDAEIFLEAVKKLGLEFYSANPKEQRKILLSRFEDAFYPEKESPKTKFFDEFAFMPIKIKPDLDFEKNSVLIDPKSAEFSLPAKMDVLQYGPSTIYRLPPASALFAKLEEQDIIASTDFSSCRALVGINEKGQAMFCHISSEWQGQEELISALKKKFGKGNLHYIYPKEVLTENASQEALDRVKDLESKHLAIAEKFGLIPHSYFELSSREQAINPNQVSGTTISLSQKGIQLVNYREEFYDEKTKAKNPYNNQRRYQKIIEETRIDIEL